MAAVVFQSFAAPDRAADLHVLADATEWRGERDTVESLDHLGTG
jgi:hypothetical protein